MSHTQKDAFSFKTNGGCQTIDASARSKCERRIRGARKNRPLYLCWRRQYMLHTLYAYSRYIKCWQLRGWIDHRPSINVRRRARSTGSGFSNGIHRWLVEAAGCWMNINGHWCKRWPRSVNRDTQQIIIHRLMYRILCAVCMDCKKPQECWAA